LASISPVLLGASLAFYDQDIRVFVFILTLICAVLLQIAVNLANDLFDSRSCVDTEHRQGPLRGIQLGQITEKQLIHALTLIVLLSMISGVLLVYLTHWGLLIFGVAALVAVFTYSAGPWPLASHGMGEITVFFFFGWLAVGGSYYVHTLIIQPYILMFGSIAGLLGAAIMLVNNIRDIPTDKLANKHTLAVKLGDRRARKLYKLILIAVCILHVITIMMFDEAMQWLLLLPLVCIILPMCLLFKQVSLCEGKAFNALLAYTALLECIYCVMMGSVLVYLRFDTMM